MPENNDTLAQPVNWGMLKILFDAARWLIPVLWVVFQYVNGQNAVIEASKSAGIKIASLETKLNEQDRIMIGIRGDIRALQAQLSVTQQFFEQTRRR